MINPFPLSRRALRRFSSPHGLVVLAVSLCLSGAAHATCTGWGGSMVQSVDLGLPATLTLTASNSTTGTVLASGSTSVPPLTCTNVQNRPDYNMTAVNWNSSLAPVSGNPSLRYVAAGIALRLKYTGPGGQSTLTGASTGGSYTQSSGGLNWSAVSWELVRVDGTVTPGQVTGGMVVSVATRDEDNTGQAPTLQIRVNNAVTVAATCTLAVDKSLVTLPDTDAGALTQAGYSSSVPLSAGITCPGNTTISNGTTLTLSTSKVDGLDNTLVGSTGTATGVAIEVLNDKGTRVSAQNGTVAQAAFTQGSNTAAPGATQAFSVRMAHQAGVAVTAGTVQGVFTLTLTLN